MRITFAVVAISTLAVAGARTAHAQRAPVTLEPVGQWGCMECTTGHQFGEIAAIGVTRAGVIHAIDRDEPRVRIFDPSGALGRAFGRRGRGPGELEVPTGIAISADGSIQIADLRNVRLTRLAPDGTVLGTVPLSAISTTMAHHPARAEIWLAFTDFRDGGYVERWMPGASERSAVIRLAEFPPSEGVAGTVHSMAASPDGGLAIGDGIQEYRIRRFGPDGRVAGPDIVRDIPRVEKSAEELAQQEERMSRMGSQMRAAAEGQRPGAGSAVRMPAVAPLRNHFNYFALRYDDAGRLWVRTERGSAGRTIFDLFDPDGRFAGAIEVPARLREYDIAGEYLAAATVGDDELPMISLWRIREP